jgi:ABC-type transporter Mla subunit MlaD
MARSFALLALVLGAALVAVVLVGARDDEDERYRVRAIFENAGFVIADEDVKVAGVKVGRVDSVEVTEDSKAAIVLDIEEPGFQDFRKDASCRVRPQSLIGERFVECTPTRKRAVGAPAPGPLERIADGPGEGQYLLPATQTEQSVDLDLIANIYRLPYRQRLSIIINEFGGALAGRGEDLGRVIRQGNPALREVQEVLRILATQNDELERLARDSDRALAPWRAIARASGASWSPPPISDRRRSSAAPSSKPASSACRASCASCARRCATSARRPTRPLPCCRISKASRRSSTPSSATSGRSRRAALPAPRHAR